MSHSSILEAPVAIGSQPNLCVGPASKEGEISAESRAALLARAKDIIAGRLRPDPLPDPPGADEYLQREFGDKVPPPTPEAVRRIKEEWALQLKYNGEGIVYFRSEDGSMAVLGSGDDEILALLRGLSDTDRRKVIVRDTDPI